METKQETQSGLVLCTTQSGTLLKVRGDARQWFAGRPQRVLDLYVQAACNDASIDWQAFAAANEEARGIAFLPPQQVYDALDKLLLSAHPDAVAPLLMTGALEAFGLPQPACCLRALQQQPAKRCARWGALLRLCGAQVPAVARALPLVQMLAITTGRLRQAGVRGRSTAAVQGALLRTVLAEEGWRLNTLPTLEQMAKGLHGRV